MRTTRIGAILLWIAGVATAQAEDRNPLNATAMLDMGGFFLSTDVRVRLDGEDGSIGDTIDFEDTFGNDRFQRFRVDGLWRIRGSHSIRGTYFKNFRTGTRELERDIHFGDETYPLGVSTTGRWELEVMQLSYDYAFKREEKYELAAGIGVHMLDANLGLDATVTGGGGSVSRELSESGSTDAPLPVLGLRGTWALPHDLYVTAQAQFFYIDFDDYVGSLSDLKANIIWQATPRFGVGLGYNDFRFRFKLDKDLFDGRLRWNYGGAMAFASVIF
jgi:hypothetical protein